MEPTTVVYDGIEYIVKYDFEHMGYILNSKDDTSFSVNIKHYHKLVVWLRQYTDLPTDEILEIGNKITENFLNIYK